MNLQQLNAVLGADADAVILNLNDHTIQDDQVISATATAGITFKQNGDIVFIGNNIPASPDADEWDSNKTGDGALYEVAFTTLVSGTAPTALAAALGVFVTINADRTWSLSATDELLTGTYRFRVREIADPSGNFDDGDMVCNAFVTP